jgi:hypothetical protein
LPAAAALLTANIPVASAQSITKQAKPDLVVLIAIDQFGSLLFDKWRGSYKSGFKRIVDGGIVYSDATISRSNGDLFGSFHNAHRQTPRQDRHRGQ